MANQTAQITPAISYFVYESLPRYDACILKELKGLRGPWNRIFDQTVFPSNRQTLAVVENTPDISGLYAPVFARMYAQQSGSDEQQLPTLEKAAAVFHLIGGFLGLEELGVVDEKTDLNKIIDKYHKLIVAYPLSYQCEFEARNNELFVQSPLGCEYHVTDKKFTMTYQSLKLEGQLDNYFRLLFSGKILDAIKDESPEVQDVFLPVFGKLIVPAYTPGENIEVPKELPEKLKSLLEQKKKPLSNVFKETKESSQARYILASTILSLCDAEIATGSDGNYVQEISPIPQKETARYIQENMNGIIDILYPPKTFTHTNREITNSFNRWMREKQQASDSKSPVIQQIQPSAAQEHGENYNTVVELLKYIKSLSNEAKGELVGDRHAMGDGLGVLACLNYGEDPSCYVPRFVEDVNRGNTGSDVLPQFGRDVNQFVLNYTRPKDLPKSVRGVINNQIGLGGIIVELGFERLLDAAFESDWIDQKKLFDLKKKLEQQQEQGKWEEFLNN